MSGTFVQLRKGRFLELPEPNGKPFYLRAESVYKSNHPKWTPDKKEKTMYVLYVAEFMSHPHNQDLDLKTKLELGDIYAVEMITSRNDGDV